MNTQKRLVSILIIFIGIFLFNICNTNTVFANSDFVDGKIYILKSKDIKISVTDIDVSMVSQLKPGEGLIRVDISNLFGDAKDIRLKATCSSSNYDATNICNNEFELDSKASTNGNFAYFLDDPKSKIKLEFTIYDRDNPNFRSYTLKKIIGPKKTNNNKSELKITSPRDGKKVFLNSGFFLEWKTNLKNIVDILNCMPDKTGCKTIEGIHTVKGSKGSVYIKGDSIMSGNSLIKIENVFDPEYFDYVEVVASPEHSASRIDFDFVKNATEPILPHKNKIPLTDIKISAKGDDGILSSIVLTDDATNNGSMDKIDNLYLYEGSKLIAQINRRFLLNNEYFNDDVQYDFDFKKPLKISKNKSKTLTLKGDLGHETGSVRFMFSGAGYPSDSQPEINGIGKVSNQLNW